MRNLLIGLGVVVVTGAAAPDRPTPEQAVADVVARVPGVAVCDVPATGRFEAPAAVSLTADRLRGVVLDDQPPVLGQPAKAYPPNMTDASPAGEAPYVARGLAPFRLRWYHAEFSYGGWHTWAMTDYAAAHGFDIVTAYNRQPADAAHLPAGTRWLKWGGFVDWPKWLPANGLGEGRYDQLVDLDLVAKLREAKTFAVAPGFDSLMIDLEHGLLGPEALRKQPWYPAAASEAERAAFERRYYAGYAKTYTAPLEAARQEGWRDRSVYGWQPFGRTWFGLEQAAVDPATDFAWNAYGRAIYEAVDILNPSVYCFYASPANVAYTLANLDLNARMIAAQPGRKPTRPYYWTLLHGGGGGWRWWAGQPLPDEDARAMTLLGFFCGIDGLVNWNWAGTGDHTRPTIKADTDLMVGRPFERAPEGSDAATAFARYDVLHLTAVADGQVRFQKVVPTATRENYGVGEGRPVYTMPAAELQRLLRPAAEPVAAMVEALAMVKVLEPLLRFGEVRIDVPAQQQFATAGPIVRRVEAGPYQVVATYDPGWQVGRQPAAVELRDFAGRAGLTVVLPADREARVFLLRLP